MIGKNRASQTSGSFMQALLGRQCQGSGAGGLFLIIPLSHSLDGLSGNRCADGREKEPVPHAKSLFPLELAAFSLLRQERICLIYGARLNGAQFLPPPQPSPTRGEGETSLPPPWWGRETDSPHPNPPPPTPPHKGGGRNKPPSPLVGEGWGGGERSDRKLRSSPPPP